MPINIVYSLNDKYAAAAGASIKSLCCNAYSTDDITIFILCSELSDENAEKLKQLSKECSVELCFKKISIEDFAGGNCLYSVNYLSCEMYFRLFIAKILQSEDKALYLDCDTIVTGDICELYKTDISNHIMGAVYDFPNIPRAEELSQIGIEKSTYFNSGVLLINLNKFRENDIFNKSIKFIENHKGLKCPDQDVLNIVCKGKIMYLDDRWNFQWGHCIDEFIYLDEEDCRRYKKTMDNFFLLHFTSPQKPWNSFACPNLGSLFWEYALFTPFKEDLFFEMIDGSSKKYIDKNIGSLVNKSFSEGKIGFKFIIKFLNSWLLFKIKKISGGDKNEGDT